MAKPSNPVWHSVLRNSDTNHRIKWTHSFTTSTKPDHIVIMRRVWSGAGATASWGAWSVVLYVAADSKYVANKEWTDTTTVRGRAYQWRVRYGNNDGAGGWATSPYVATTPNDPSFTSIKANAAGVAAVWQGRSASPTVLTYVFEYEWLRNGVVVSVGETAASNPQHTLNFVDRNARYKMRLRARINIGTTLRSAWVTSAEIAAAAPPAAPSGLDPATAGPDFMFDAVFSWKHNTVDGSDQTQYEARYFPTTASYPNSPIALSSGFGASSFTLPAETFANDQDYIWQVRTKGVSTVWSPWSEPTTIRGNARPTAMILSPSSDDPTPWPSSTIRVTWSFNDPASDLQSQYEIELHEGGGRVEHVLKQGGDWAETLQTPALDGHSYKIRLRLRDTKGAWSDWTEETFTVDMIPPIVSTLEADYVESNGYTLLILTPGAHDPARLPAVNVSIFRRFRGEEDGDWGMWELLVDNLAIDASISDLTTGIAGDVQYKAVTYSALPSSDETVPISVSAEPPRWLYVSGGEYFQNICRMWANIELTYMVNRDSQLHKFAGRSKPVLFTGKAVHREISVGGLLDYESSGVEEWERLGQMGGVMLYRDPLGRRIYGQVSDISIQRLNNGLHSIAFIIKEVDFG